MGNKIYVGDIGTVIVLDTNEDISSATTTDIKVKKGDGTTATWTGLLFGSDSVTYTIVDGDLSCPGTYKVQTYIVMTSWSGLGETAEFHVYDEFE
jgi:hypothetical protein